MSFLDLVKRRQTIRKYNPEKPVEQEKIDNILEAMRLAPTAKNKQPQKVFLLRSQQALDKINQCSPCIYGAPIVFLVCFDTELEWVRPFDNFDGGWFDASIVTTHMMMQATMDKLGSTWVEYFDPALVKQTFDLPDNLVPAALLLVGYPADDCPESPNHNKSRKLDEMLTTL
ncbi:MAG: nitroreductase family protein [Oscillospiraceae bacterium]|nr:nitroreductase family protein [Oscillospiraceae bacterium]